MNVNIRFDALYNPNEKKYVWGSKLSDNYPNV